MLEDVAVMRATTGAEDLHELPLQLLLLILLL